MLAPKDREILERLDLAAEYRALGVEFLGRPNARGWIACRAVDRDDDSPSAAVNVQTGRYKDHGGDGENCSLFDFRVRVGKAADWREARQYYADRAGVELDRRGKGKQGAGKHEPDPSERLAFGPWSEMLAWLWTQKKSGTTTAAIQAAGGQLATYLGEFRVIALPVRGSFTAADPVGYVLFNTTGKGLPRFTGKGKPPEWLKVLVAPGSRAGLLVAGDLDAVRRAAVVWCVEGPTDLMALWSAMPEELRSSHAVVAVSNGANQFPDGWIVEGLADKTVYLVRDADKAGEESLAKWGPVLARRAREVRAARLPYPIEPKHGKDLRDYLNDGNTFADVLRLAEAGPAFAAVELAPVEADDDPHRLARVILGRYYTTPDGDLALRFYRDEWHQWEAGAYVRVPTSELRAMIARTCKEEFDRINLAAQQDSKKGKEPPEAERVTVGLVSNVLLALQGLTCIRSQRQTPCWLDDANPWPADEVLSTASGVLHVPSYVQDFLGTPTEHVIPPTARLFTPNVLPYAFAAEPASPDAWLSFLDSLWGDDLESKQCLQEWFGYCLLPDTRHHKMLWIMGPMRSGKGTIARTLAATVGHENRVTPTLSSLGTNFGAWPLIGKTLAIVGDARISGRSDTSVVIERLLSISGEDSQTIDRKNLPPITTKLATRFVVLSNEIPDLKDASAALGSRVLLLRTTESFLNRENKHLDDNIQAELPGILFWAIEGWHRLRVQGRFTEPGSSREMSEEFRRASSPITAFVEDRCAVGEANCASAADLYAAWVEWCQDNGHKHGTLQAFFRKLRAAVPKVESTQDWERQGTRGKRVYAGITVRSANFN